MKVFHVCSCLFMHEYSLCMNMKIQTAKWAVLHDHPIRMFPEPVSQNTSDSNAIGLNGGNRAATLAHESEKYTASGNSHMIYLSKWVAGYCTILPFSIL